MHVSARIDRLPPQEKQLLQSAAVIGKDVPFSLLQAITELSDEELRRGLTHLQAAEFLYETSLFPELEYSFKHALTLEVSYGSLLIERRRALHERTGQAIESLYANQLEAHCNELAHHFSRSGNSAKAVTYLLIAGRQAVQRSAEAEAVSHLTNALALLQTQPDSPERARRELELLIVLGPAWMASRGPASPQVEATYQRALALYKQVFLEVSLPVQRTLALCGSAYLAQSRYKEARDYYAQAVEIQRQVADDTLPRLSEAEALQYLDQYLDQRDLRNGAVRAYYRGASRQSAITLCRDKIRRRFPCIDVS